MTRLAWLTLLLTIAGGAGSPPASKSTTNLRGLEVDYRQVTVFGVLIIPEDPTAIDPKLVKLQKQLQRLKPNSGFKFRGSESRRLAPGESLTSDLGEGISATTELVDAMNVQGKVQFKFTLNRDGKPEFTTTVTTPPNQVFYIEKILPKTRNRLLIGVGGR